jgi:HD-GYP domain-containing protein (c-di-GMP phosphodiesterase class II)
MPMPYLDRGLTPAETALLDGEDVAIELVLALMAVPLAAFWRNNMPLAALSVAPVFLIYFTQRAVFQLEHASETITDQNASLEQAHGTVIERSTNALEALSATVDARDKYTAGHSRRVAQWSAIRHHHERPDGRGYPDGLLDQQIPVAARVIHAADALDAMTTKRPYRGEMSFDDALMEIRRGRGTDFCEKCVDALDRAVAAKTAGKLRLVREVA